jgi:F0F1-type ATP synthase membrane subunit c/vacuolar-type H+-ATPase subunit K
MENRQTDFQPQEPQSEQKPVPTGTGTTGTPLAAPAKMSNRNVLIIIIGGLLVGLCCISACVGIAGLIGTGVVKMITEEPKVEGVIDEYLNAMADQDASKAYTFLSTRAKRNVTLADIEKGLEANNYTVFEGYQSIAVANFNLYFTVDSGPDMPQGEVAEVDGMISYAGGFSGDFSAVLERDGQEWRLFSINVNAPADKFGQ